MHQLRTQVNPAYRRIIGKRGMCEDVKKNRSLHARWDVPVARALAELRLLDTKIGLLSVHFGTRHAGCHLRAG